jgi:Co/Zn/Cd efflux system component
MFSYEILLIWTKNSVTAENTHILLSLLICGTALHGLMNMPYTVQLAYGWTKLSIIGNFIAVILLVPMIVFMTYKFGAPGAASVWIILNSGYILFSIHFMHKRLLISEKWHWYWHDIVTPFGVSFLIAGLGRLLITGQSSQFIMILNLGIISICTLGAAAIATKTTREWVFNKILDFKLTLKN